VVIQQQQPEQQERLAGAASLGALVGLRASGKSSGKFGDLRGLKGIFYPHDSIS